MKLYKDIGNIIKDTRIDANLSREKLSEISNVCLNTIGKIERAEIVPSLPSLYKLCKALNLKMSDLFKDY